jgi:CBS domain-containing protein
VSERDEAVLAESANDLFSQLDTMMTRPVAAIDWSAPLRMAVELMADDTLGALVVVGPDGPTRIITERDVLSALAEEVDPDSLLVDDVATGDLVSADRDSTVIDAARLMVGYGIRHVPVVSDDGRVIGMVSARDVLRVLVDEIETNTSKARSR